MNLALSLQRKIYLFLILAFSELFPRKEQLRNNSESDNSQSSIGDTCELQGVKVVPNSLPLQFIIILISS